MKINEVYFSFQYGNEFITVPVIMVMGDIELE